MNILMQVLRIVSYANSSPLVNRGPFHQLQFPIRVHMQQEGHPY